MKKLLLLASLTDPINTKNSDTIMRALSTGEYIPNHLAARFSNIALAKQQGVYQKIAGIVFVHIEICPDINNPLGGGATVSFNSGDTIALPLAGASPQVYVAGDLLGRDSLVLTQLTTGTKYTNCYVRTNATSGQTEVVINHSIAATASTFLLEGIYLLRN